MIKYITGGFENIKEIEVHKETEKTVWFKDKDYTGKIIDSKSSKRSAWRNWHDTWEDAHNFLLEKTKKNIKKQAKLLRSMKKYLCEVEEMKKH